MPFAVVPRKSLAIATQIPTLKSEFFDNLGPESQIHTIWGRTGFDGVSEFEVACRGARGHVKTGKQATANDNAVALAA